MKTARSIALGLAIVGLATAAFKFWPQKEAGASEGLRTAVIVRGPLSVLNQFEGSVESERTLPVSSSLSQRATIVELAPEGRVVQAGEVLVRFDSSPFGQALIQLEKDLVIAQANLDELRLATLPLELDELDARSADIENEVSREEKYLEDVRELQEENLMGIKDVRQQEMKVDQVRKKEHALVRRIKLTREHVHPAALVKAQAALQSAMKDLEHALSQEEACEVRAAQAGFVMYKPMHMDGEFRTVRPGDSVYRNQVFMMLADQEEMVARCYVPEGQFGVLRVGAPAKISPLAMPGVQLNGRVKHVGSMAHRITGKPNWQKFVQVEVELSKPDARLRSGMSVFVQILSYQRSDAVLVPRAALDWENGKAFVDVVTGEQRIRKPLTLGAGNASHFEVLEGLSAGETIVLP